MWLNLNISLPGSIWLLEMISSKTLRHSLGDCPGLFVPSPALRHQFLTRRMLNYLAECTSGCIVYYQHQINSHHFVGGRWRQPGVRHGRMFWAGTWTDTNVVKNTTSRKTHLHISFSDFRKWLLCSWWCPQGRCTWGAKRSKSHCYLYAWYCLTGFLV